MSEEENLVQYSREDARVYGVEFRRELLKTSPDEPQQIREGQACLQIVERILYTILAEYSEDQGAEDDDSAAE